MNVILYARASSDRQADKGLSIPAQLRALRDHCEKNGHIILKEFVDEGWSGTTDQRPGFQAMVQYARLHKDQLDAVLVWKQNRFSRDRIHAAVYKRHLREQGVDVMSLTEPSVDSIDGELLEAVVEAVDSRFSKSLAQDVMRGIREVAKRGFYPLAVAPWGYRKVEVDDGKATRFRLIPDEQIAPLIRHIFELYTSQDLGAKNVAQTLNAEGLTTKTGKPWSTKIVLKVLENASYIGTLHVEFTTKNARYLSDEDRVVKIEDAFPAIVDRDLFAQAQALRKQRARTHPRELGSDYLLSGLLRCTTCGSRLYGVSAKSSRNFYYTCKRFYESGKHACGFGFVNRDRLDSVVVEKVRDVLLEEECLRELAGEVNRELGGQDDVRRKERALIQSQLKEKRQQVERLVDAIERGEMGYEALRTRLQSRRGEVERLQARHDDLDEARNASRCSHLDMERIRPYVESLREVLGSAPVRVQRAVLKSFIREIRVGKDAIAIEFSIPQPQQIPSGSGFAEGVLGMVTSGTPGVTPPRTFW